MPAIDRSVAADVPLFAGLAASEFDEVLREAHSVRYPKGAAVFEQGSEATSFFVLLHGHLRVEQSAQQGHQIVVRYVSTGEIFGVAQALALTRYPAAALAVVDSVVLCWPSAAWSRLSAKFPALAANALQTVGRRLQETQTRIQEMSSEQVEQRVVHVLLRLAKQRGASYQASLRGGDSLKLILENNLLDRVSEGLLRQPTFIGQDGAHERKGLMETSDYKEPAIWPDVIYGRHRDASLLAERICPQLAIALKHNSIQQH